MIPNTDPTNMSWSIASPLTPATIQGAEIVPHCPGKVLAEWVSDRDTVDQGSQGHPTPMWQTNHAKHCGSYYWYRSLILFQHRMLVKQLKGQTCEDVPHSSDPSDVTWFHIEPYNNSKPVSALPATSYTCFLVPHSVQHKLNMCTLMVAKSNQGNKTTKSKRMV